MFVTYIGDTGFYDGLTYGYVYEVIEISNEQYVVYNDLGGTSTIRKEKFEMY